MLMGAGVVVPGPEFHQFDAQVVTVGKDDAVQLLLERTEESLDTSVLLGAMQRGGLQVDAQQSQGRLHRP